MTVRTRRWAIGLVAVLAIAACGGGEGDAAATDAPTAAATAAGEQATTAASRDAATESGRRTYVVEPGDTLTSIAERFDTTVEAIVRTNDIDDPDVIDVGVEFVIPRP